MKMKAKNLDNTERINLEKIEEKQDEEKRKTMNYSPYEKVKPHFKAMLSHYREYPDLFLDMARSPDALFGLAPFQRVYLRTLMRYKKVGIVASRGLSKCVVGDTLISTGDGLQKIGDLAEWKKEESIDYRENEVLNIHGEKEKSSIIYSNGYQDTKKITTKYGYEIEGTLNHPLIVMNKDGDMEFKDIRDINAGDYIAINRKGVFGNKTKLDFDMKNFMDRYSGGHTYGVKDINVPKRLTEDLAYYMGLLVGDGHLGLDNGVIFSSADKESIDFFKEYSKEEFGLNVIKRNENKYDYIFNSVYVRDYLRQIGLGFEGSRDKTVPKQILMAPKNIVSSFISGLFDADATVSKSGVVFGTSSKEMSIQIQQLLLQFGIESSRSEWYNQKYNNHNYTVSISSSASDIYERDIGFRLKRKTSKLKQINSVIRNSNNDIIPNQKDRITRLVDKNKRYKNNKYIKNKNNGLLMTSSTSHIRAGRNELTYNRLKDMFDRYEFIEDNDFVELSMHLQSNYFWDEVVEEEFGEDYVYDFYVDESHTFVGNGFINHNTYVNVLGKYTKCILYPNTHEAIAMPTKNQSAKVTEEKITEIWRDYPMLKNEVREISFQKDYVRLIFKNGSTLDTLTVGESSRGLRANGISLEEIVDPRMDRDTRNEVILPILAQPRRTRHGVDPNEVSLTQAYVTTASHKQSYAYEKFKEIYDEMVVGRSSILLVTSYEMGVRFGTLRLEEVQEKMESATYSPLSFDRILSSVLETLQIMIGQYRWKLSFKII